jgi:hypothetical protein
VRVARAGSHATFPASSTCCWTPQPSGDPFRVDWTDPTPGSALAQQMWLCEEGDPALRSPNALPLSPASTFAPPASSPLVSIAGAHCAAVVVGGRRARLSSARPSGLSCRNGREALAPCAPGDVSSSSRSITSSTRGTIAVTSPRGGFRVAADGSPGRSRPISLSSLCVELVPCLSHPARRHRLRRAGPGDARGAPIGGVGERLCCRHGVPGRRGERQERPLVRNAGLHRIARR